MFLLPLIPGASLSLRLRLGLLVVRPSHLCRGATTSTLNGTGQLVEALLEAQGWGAPKILGICWKIPKKNVRFIALYSWKSPLQRGDFSLTCLMTAIPS
jgi:hypothetical protein